MPWVILGPGLVGHHLAAVLDRASWKDGKGGGE